MRLIKFSLLLLTGFVLIQSCQKEIGFEEVPAGNCLSCSYLPLCDSSVFKYIDSSAQGIDTLNTTTFILGDSVINGRSFRSVSGFANFGTGVYVNCDNQDYRMLLPLSALGLNIDSLIQDFLGTLQLPIPIPPGTITAPSTIQTTIVKAGQPVGTTWTDSVLNFNLPPLFSFYAALQYNIVEKGVSRSFHGKTYNNVIHTRASLVAGGTFGNLPTGIFIDFYLASGIGLIELTFSSNGAVDNSLKLIDHQL